MIRPLQNSKIFYSISRNKVSLLDVEAKWIVACRFTPFGTVAQDTDFIYYVSATFASIVIILKCNYFRCYIILKLVWNYLSTETATIIVSSLNRTIFLKIIFRVFKPIAVVLRKYTDQEDQNSEKPNQILHDYLKKVKLCMLVADKQS